MAAVLLQRPLDPSAVLRSMALTSAERRTFLERLSHRDLFSDVEHRTLKHLLLRAEGDAHSMQEGDIEWLKLQVEKMVPQYAPDGSSWRRAKLVMGGGRQGDGEAESSSEMKYWFEVQRINWHAKLGNLVLLQPHAPRAAQHSTAEYDEKAAFYRQSGSDRMFPRFTGALVGAGKYAETMFSFEACRQRQQDLLAVLCDIYQLKQEAEDVHAAQLSGTSQM